MLSFLAYIAFSQVVNTRIQEQKDFYYLSDLDYIKDSSQSYAGYGEIVIDGNIEHKIIKLVVDDNTIPFLKGIGIHATGQITFNVAQYSNDFPIFTGYVGIDASRIGGDVKFTILVSDDGSHWDSKIVFESIGRNRAEKFSVDIAGKQFLRIHIYDKGDDSYDHSIIADAKLQRRDYQPPELKYDKIETVAAYDALIKSRSIEENYADIKTLQLRELCYRLNDKPVIVSVVNSDPKIKAAMDWLIDDSNALELLIECGESDHYFEILLQLSKLYDTYKDDLSDPTNGPTYKKMLIAVAFVYETDYQATPIGSMTIFNLKDMNFNLVERFALYKEMYKRFLPEYVDQFKGYNMELMRLIMNTAVPNDEMVWLRDYADKVVKEGKERFYYENYIKYDDDLKFDPWAQTQYWDETQKSKWDEKYDFLKYNIEYGVPKEIKYWMQFDNGSVCFGLSRIGQEIRKLHGQVAHGTFQPAHEAILYYELDEKGNGIWKVDFDVSGIKNSYADWTDEGIPEYKYRMPLGYSERKITRCPVNRDKKYSSTYIFVAQAAFNEMSKLKKSMYISKIANSYPNDDVKLMEISRAALEALPINVYAYDNIVEIYERSNNKKSADWVELATEIIKAFENYPTVFSDYVDYFINSTYFDPLDLIKIHSLKDEALRRCKDLPNGTTYQTNVCKEIASRLLDDSEVELVSFSFDGPDANTLVVNPYYDSVEMRLQYSLDGGNHYEETQSHKIVFTKDQIASITSANDIKVKVVGLPNDIHVLDIKDGEAIYQNDVEQNDFENRLLGKTDGIEWSTDGNNYSPYTATTRFVGETTVFFRKAAFGLTLPGPSIQYTFHADETDLKYINIEDISFVAEGYNHEYYFDPQHMLDGSLKTKYHTAWGETATNKSFYIKFTSPRTLGKLTYESAPDGANGRIERMTVFVKPTEDSDYVKVGESETDWPNNDDKKTLIMNDRSVKALYVHLLPTSTHTNGNGEPKNTYVSGVRYNFYETWPITINQVSGLVESFKYTGSGIEQTFTITDERKQLSENTDYEIEYSNNVNVGDKTATLTIKGINNYAGSEVTYKYSITKAEQSVNVVVEENKITVTGNQVPYNIKYFSDSSASKEVPEPTKNGVYYIKIFVPSTDNYLKYESGIHKLVITKVQPRTLTIDNIKGLVESFEYTGSALEQTFTVVDEQRELVKDVDYTVEYKDNINVGDKTAILIIRGKNNYAGEITYKYSITKANTGADEDDSSEQKGSDVTSGIGTGPIIGIVVGCVLVVAAIGISIFFILKKKKVYIQNTVEVDE